MLGFCFRSNLHEIILFVAFPKMYSDQDNLCLPVFAAAVCTIGADVLLNI